MSDSSIKVGIIGARGYTGAELISLIEMHPKLELAYAASRSQAGEPIPNRSTNSMNYIDAAVDHVATLGADVVVLAVPDGASQVYVDVLESKVILDLSSDHRFDPTWVYGLSELNESQLRTATRISNPGCYATAVQLALAPIAQLLASTPHAFGVSGYSGAGTNPSPRNDPAVLADGITPYKVVDHTHEREISYQLGFPVRFSPHVAPFFRGITVTVQATLKERATIESISNLYEHTYTNASLIKFLGQTMPRVQDIAHSSTAQIGGLSIAENGQDLAVVCVIDNLLKGAASQAVQNINLAFGLNSEYGLDNATTPTGALA